MYYYVNMFSHILFYYKKARVLEKQNALAEQKYQKIVTDLEILTFTIPNKNRKNKETWITY